MIPRAKSLIPALLVFLALLHPAVAQTRQVPPPGSPNANAATRNVEAVIKALRSKGFYREAGQLNDLLKRGRVYYHATGGNIGNSRFIHSLKPGDPGWFYFARTQMNDPDGKGAQRYPKDNGRPLHLAVKAALHELTHVDQGQPAIIESGNLAPVRGYALHEIEAYRIALKKYVTPWVIDPIKAYLANRGGMTDAQKEAALDALMDQLYPLVESLEYLGYKGANDRVCRWQAIKQQVVKLNDALLALQLDLASRRLCKKHLKSANPNKQSTTWSANKVSALRRRITSLNKRIVRVSRRVRTDRAARAALARRLRRSTDREERLTLAARIGRYDTRLRTYRKQLADDRSKRQELRAELKRVAAMNKKARQVPGSGPSKFDQCRLLRIGLLMAKNKLKASQLPPDMVLTPGGGVALVKPGKSRKIDLASIVDALKDRFDYSGKLNWKDAKGDPRTPCYKPKKSAKKKVATQSPRAKTKKVCKGRGGLIGHVNCVGKRIEGGR